MLLKNTALLLVAAVLVLDIIPATFGQEASAEDTTATRLQRQRAQAARRTKLFEAQQQQQQEKVSAVAGAAAGSTGSRRRLVSKTRVGGRTTTAAPITTTITEAPTTAPPTEAPIPVTEEQQRFTDFSSFVDSNVEDDDPEVEDEEIQFRPRATAAPVVVARTTTKAPVTAAARRPVSRPVVIALDDEEEESDPQPLPVQRQRPIAGPVRSRVQEQSRSSSADSIPRDTNAPALVKPSGASSRTRTTEKPDIVETVRRYNFESDDGSFTFGYENADGSFKEETRRPDCIVIGKYGYIDPDGIKREFTYQTGNQCDPDAHKRQESSAEEEDEEEDEVPVRRPNVPARRPVNTPRPSAASPTRRPNIPDVQTVRRPVVQQQQVEEQDESAEIAQVLNTPTRISRPQTVSQPERVSRPVAQPTPAARPVAARPSSSSVLDLESELDRLTGAQPQRRPVFNDDDDEEAFVPRRPVQQPQAPQQPARQTSFQPLPQQQVQPFRQFIQPGSDLGNNPIRSFTSELVFDPRTNQFTSAFQQRIPETNEEINISGNLGGFVFNPQTTTTPSPLRAEFNPQLQFQRPAAPIQQQQQQNFFGPSVEDQERIRQQQEAQRQQEETQRIQLEQQRIAQENVASRARPAAQFPAGVGSFQSQQPFFGVAPAARTPVSVAQRPTFATGQIDQFLSSLG